MVMVLIVGIILALLVMSLFFYDVPKKYRERSCTGRAWKNAYPACENEEIRSFLLLFVDAFGFPQNSGLKFEPKDRLIDIYRALYPSKWMPDQLEFETLAIEIKRMYGVDLDKVWREELTLGELFKQVSGA